MKKLLTLGDSIAHGYRKHLIAALGAEYEVCTKEGEEEAARDLNYPVGSNCGDSRMMLAYLTDEYKNGRLNYDIIMFNCGQHDVKTNLSTGKRQVDADEYEANLEKICEVVKKNGAKLWFVNTTPVFEAVHNTPENIVINKNIVRYAKDVITCNEAASRVMEKFDIPIIDLYSLTLTFTEKALRDHAHYYPEYEQRQGEFLADIILRNT